MLLIGDAVARVFLRHAIERSTQPQALVDSTRLLMRVVFYIILPPMILLMVQGPALFELVFGAEWTEAGRFARILAISFFISFVYRVLSVFFDIHERQRMRLTVDAAQLLARIVALLAGGLLWGVDGAIWGLLIATVLIHGAAIVYLLGLVGLGRLATAGLVGEALVNLAPIIALLAMLPWLADAGVLAWLAVPACIALQAMLLGKREPRLVSLATGRFP
jgi:O-antigen/teichoic acid export membrane protein